MSLPRALQERLLRAPLKVYGRRAADAAGALAEVEIDASASVAALTKALIAELQLGVPPDRVVLTLLNDDGAVVKVLSSKATLSAAGVTSGATVVAAVRPSFLELPQPLVFTPEVIGGTHGRGGELMMVATLDDGATHVPIFLTEVQYAALLRFVDEAPSHTPRMLMVDGTIKSGKTTIVHEVMPRLLAARFSAPPSPPSSAPLPVRSASPSAAPAPLPGPHKRVLPRPVIFKYTFPLSGSAADAAHHFMRALGDFATSITVPFSLKATPSESLDRFPAAVAEFAERVRAGGGELWLLLDELQGPLLSAVDQNEATKFVLQFKQVCRGRAAVVEHGCRRGRHRK